MSATDDEDDQILQFMGTALPVIAAHITAYEQRTKRKVFGSKSVNKLPKIDGHIGRKWEQRKAGDIKPSDFSWWRLIHKPDVADVKSRNGKVCVHLHVFDCVYLLVFVYLHLPHCLS